MPRKSVITIEKVRDELAKIAFQVKRGDIDPKVGNSLANLWGKVLYSFQTQSSTEETKKALERLEVIERCLVDGDFKTLQRFIAEEEQDAEG